MQRIISTAALVAALAAILVALWRDYGVLVALKRATISYLAFYFVASLLALVFRWGIQQEKKDEDLAASEAASEKETAEGAESVSR